MDKQLILAVAGSGKTTYIIDSLSFDKKSIILTYTQNNYNNLRDSIIKKFGFIPSNIRLLTFFNFLYSFCFKPFLSYKMQIKGISWETPPMYLKKNKPEFYVTCSNRLFHNRISKLLIIKNVIPEICQRLEKYYDFLFIDEVQDIAGNDFNLLLDILKAKVNIILVGDFYQHTFDTSRDGNVNSNLHDSISKYTEHFTKRGILVNQDKLHKSYRCRTTICNFISSNLSLKIESHCDEDSSIIILDQKEDAEDIFKNASIIKLFYKEHYKYPCFSKNWGESKGDNCYIDVCVVLNNKSNQLFKQGNLSSLPPSTRNKLYVACSRARRNLYILPEKLIRHHKI